MKRCLLFPFMALLQIVVVGQTSPKGSISAEINVNSDISIKIRPFNDSHSHMMEILSIKGPFRPFSQDSSVHKVSYNMVTGKRSRCSNAYRQNMYLTAMGDTLTLRVYNDGVAWHCSKSSEVTLSNTKNRWMQCWKDSYENFFPMNPEVTEGSRWGYPALFEYNDGTFALLTESNIDRDCACTSMHATSTPDTFALLTDGPGRQGWQTLIIGSLSDVVESTLVTDNSASARIADTSWIQPGVAAWIYWAYNHGSNDFNIIKQYVDLAVEMSWPYVLIDAEWDEMQDGLSIEDAVAYAVKCNVKPVIWYNSSVGWIDGAPGPKFRLNNPSARDKEFEWCRSIGVKGVKIDFFSGDTNQNVSYMIDLLESAAAHGLMVNFHGATLPRGWQRTYPHLMTTEGVYGAEWYNNVPIFTARAARHNATLPFTRNVVGSMDYTPCAFSDSQHPHITTHAHELALTVLFESGIQHIADRPESILEQPAEVRSFLSELPASWDETVLLCGYPGEYVVMARRSGNDWYVAGINGSDRMRTIKLDYKRLHFDGDSAVCIFADNLDAEASNKPWNNRQLQTLPDNILLKPRGGFVIKLTGPKLTK